MKNFLLESIMVVILLSLLGCQQNTTQIDDLQPKEDIEGFIEPEPSYWVKYIKPVTEYMYNRTQAVNDNKVIVLIHGSIVYLGNDFDESGGEYLIKVFLEQKDNHWTVIKTDEYTLPEYKEWLKEK